MSNFRRLLRPGGKNFHETERSQGSTIAFRSRFRSASHALSSWEDSVMQQGLLYAVDGKIARITLNRPDRLNALDRKMRRQWPEMIDTFNRDPDVRVGILTGGGDRAFSVGADLKEIAKRDMAGKQRTRGSVGRPVMPKKPIIAAIHGHCLAGGLQLALMCDLRIASASAQFGLPEVRRSRLPIHALDLLPKVIPRGEAAYMLLTGDNIDADKACQIGLVHKVLPDREALLQENRVRLVRASNCLRKGSCRR